MIIPFQNILLLKEFLARDGRFGLSTQVVKRSETSFWRTFSARLIHKNDLYLILHPWKVSVPYLFSFSRYETKCFIEFLFKQLMMPQTLKFIFDHPLNQWMTGRKRRKNGNTKIWISRERKELLRWNKKHSS